MVDFLQHSPIVDAERNAREVMQVPVVTLSYRTRVIPCPPYRANGLRVFTHSTLKRYVSTVRLATGNMVDGAHLVALQLWPIKNKRTQPDRYLWVFR